MIVRIFSAGASFKGLAAYLTHDAGNAETSERVAFTHTLNCANDHVPAAVNEMYHTAQDAELLKQEAGIRAGGRSTEHVVKHVSLNWSPEDDPSREHMIRTSEEFLNHMGWHEHQAVLVAHDDKEHAHVHIMLNAVHPETGLALDDSFERRRAQVWALQYEREQGQIRCEQRLKDANAREDAMPRNAWEAFRENQKTFQSAENNLRHTENDFSANPENAENTTAAEWTKLKEIQKNQRIDFFNGGKAAFAEVRQGVYREVREEFRERWSDYYQARQDGADADTLSAIKSALTADQKAALDMRRDDACKELRESRDGIYRELLDYQAEARLNLHARQEQGFDNGLFLDLLENGKDRPDLLAAYREGAEAVTARQDAREPDTREPNELDQTASLIESEGAEIDAGIDQGAAIGFGIGFNFLNLAHSLLGEFEGSSAPVQRESREDAFARAAEEVRQRQQRERDEDERERQEHQRCSWE